MNRRSFLAALGLLAGTGFAAYRWFAPDSGFGGSRTGAPSGDPVEEIVSAVRGELSFVELDDDSIRSFARAHLEALPTWRSGPPRRGFSLGMRYLYSTDFFSEGADPARAPVFQAYFDPYRTPCRDPFAGYFGAL